MDDNTKQKMRTVLEQNKGAIRSIREALVNIPDSDDARRDLLQAEFSILSGMHEISWIGLREPKTEIINDDNPSI